MSRNYLNNIGYKNCIISDNKVISNSLEITNGLEIIRQLKPKKYIKHPEYLISDQPNNFNLSPYYFYEVGLISQDILNINDLSHSILTCKYDNSFNILIDRNDHYNNPYEIYNLNYEQINIYNIKAVQELDNLINLQQSQINTNKTLLNTQQIQINTQQTQINKIQSLLDTLLSEVNVLKNKLSNTNIF